MTSRTTDFHVSPFWKEFLTDSFAGAIAGAISTGFVMPVDTILTRVQTQAVGYALASTTSSTSSINANMVMIKRIATDGGYKAFFRGLPAATTVIPLQNALLFAGYGFGERYYFLSTKAAASKSASEENTKKLLGVFVGGCTAGVVQSFAVSPFELVKVQQQVSRETVTAKEVVKGFSLRSLATRGLGSTILRDGVPHGVWFASYEYFKRSCILGNRSSSSSSSDGKDDSNDENGDVGENDTNTNTNDNTEQRKLTSIEAMSCGAGAGAVAWAVGYPFDTIKTHIQANTNASYKPTIWDAYLNLRKNGTLYRGFGLKLLRAVPASAICFVSYEECRKLID
jgi:solute carrier family 25 (mitochondrial carnitine/acylcarnitine transporter), member 20/29